MLKRLMSFLLALTMVLGMLPMTHAHATEAEEPAVEETVAEETIPEETEATVSTGNTEDVSAPTEVTVAATEEIPEYTGSTEETYETEVMEEVIEEILPTDSEQPALTSVVASGTCGDNVTWTLSDDGILAISGDGPMADYAYSSDVPWYVNNIEITSVIIKEGVTSIGNHAFSNCTSLTEAVMANTVTSIGKWAFHNCDSLMEIIIPGSVGFIGDYAFFDCNFTSIVLPSGLMSIGKSVFASCANLASVVIPDSVTDIGEDAFEYCKNLTEVYITDLIAWWNTTFGNIYADPTYFGDLNIMDADGNEIIEITLDNSVTKIPYKGFYKCRNLESIIIPDGITIIGSQAFDGCTSLKSIKIPASVIHIGSYAFNNCRSLISIELPDNLTDIGDKAFNGCASLKSILIPNSVNRIGVNTLSGCSSLESITIPFIGESQISNKYPFGYIFGTQKYNGGVAAYQKYHSGLSHNGKPLMADVTYYIPSTLKTVTVANGEIFHSSFMDCDTLTSVLIHDTATTIGDYAFYDCKSLSTIQIPNGITTIGVAAFSRCKNLSEITFIGDAPTISSNAFTDVTGTARYSASNKTWTTDILQNYGGKITWAPCCMQHTEAIYKAIPPTCTENGLTEGKYCSICDTIIVAQEIIPAKGHSFGEWKVTKAATCTEKGTERRDCKNCSKSETRDLIATDHDYKDTVTAPTCTEKGYTTHTCTRCSDTSKDTYVDALGHDGVATNVVAPTYTQAGYTEYVCSRCGHTYKDDHKDMLKLPKITIKAATSSKTGKPVVSWTAAEDAGLSYKVYRATSSKGKYSLKATVTGNSFEDTSASVGKKYYYKVKVSAPGKTGDYSNYDDATCKLAAPVIKTSVSKSSGKVKVSWGKVSSAKKYEVYRATSTGSFKKLTTTTKTSYTDSSASVGTTYRYKVKAVASKSTYNSAYSETLTAKRICAQPDLEATISTTYGKPSLSWDKVSGAKEYKILRAESQNGEYQLLTTTTSTSYTDKTAEFDKDYWYQIDEVGSKTGTDNDTDAAVKVHTTCAKPSVSITISSKKPKVSWKPVEGATKYYVYRATSKSGKYTKMATVTDATSYRDSKAKKGKTYYYKVKAIATNSAANSAYSSVKSIKSK